MANVIAVAALTLLGAALLAACGGSADGSEAEGPAKVVGAGSTAQEAVQRAWIEKYGSEEKGAKVSYLPIGSGAGRRRFIAGTVAYAASDTPLKGVELRRAAARCEPGQLVEVPAYLSKIKIGIHIGGLSFVSLTPRTLARILDGEIDRWSDPEIRHENPTVVKQLRGPIAILYPAGESGLTANLTAYLSEVAPGIWRHGSTETWPTTVSGAAVVSSATMPAAIAAREGAIGFADASRAAALKPIIIRTGSEVDDIAPPDRGSSISILEASSEAKDLKASPDMMPFNLERRPAKKGIYPIVFTSYLIACTRYDSAREAAAIRELLAYAVGVPGQEIAAGAGGSDPLVGELQKRAEAAVRAIE